MFSNDKVIWKEGIFLQPQHFQQVERFFLESMQAHLSAYNRYYSGFLNFKIIPDALANKTLSLHDARGVFPDGTWFSIPETGDIPLARDFSEHFSLKQHTMTVYLALPMVLPGRASIAESRDSIFSARYKSYTLSLTDDVSGQQTRDIELAKANYSILFEGESLDNFTSLPIVRLIRAANGKVIIDKSFIPPLLRIGSSHFLCEQLRSLLELLIAQSKHLSQGRKQLVGDFAEFAASQITPLSLLKTINTHIPLINNYFDSMNAHPYELYLILVQFAGVLCTFSSKINVTDLPVYNHTALEFVFPIIFQSIRDILGTNFSAGCVEIPFSEIAPATYLFPVDNPKLFETASFFIGINADIPQKELIAFSLPRIKIASRNQLDTLIQSAMPGLPLMYSINPPAKLSTKPGYVYFSLTKNNKFWDLIKTTGNLAMYFPNKIPDLKMEMLAVTEQDIFQ